MTEAAPKLYDIIHPTPISLKELSAMAICLELWHHKVNEYRTGGQLKEFQRYIIYNIATWIKSTLPDLPSTIYETIEKFLTRFVDSFRHWQHEHHKQVFGWNSHENYILQDFNDFACDYDCSIHYVRTAERMMRCEGFDAEIKFKIACMYFFEDEIKRIWPSVSNHLSVELIHFILSPQLYYWVCRLTNQLGKILTQNSETVDEKMYAEAMPHNRPSMEYFWNRIPLEKRIMLEYGTFYNTDFVRFILPKLEERQLDELVNDGISFYTLFRYRHFDEEVVILRTWSYIKNIMKEDTFADLVVRLIEIEKCGNEDDEEWEKPIDDEKWEYLSSEIWNDTPLNLKQSAIRLISSESDWLENMNIMVEEHYSNQIRLEFLLLILQDASSKERASFLHNCWCTLIKAILINDFQRMVQLCFKNDYEITRFKQNFIINSEVVRQVGAWLLRRICFWWFFDELNALVSFCYPEFQAARNFKEQILQPVCLGEDYQLSRRIVSKIEVFGDFVKGVSANFKNRLMSSPSFMKDLSSVICDKDIWDEEISLKILTEFSEILASTEEALIHFKMSLTDSLKEYLITSARRNRDDLFSKEEFNWILLWCLGSSEVVEEFKLTCILSLSRLT
ncbi:uncharacterized protein LOC135847767 isoform X1 [Planococcus citri]|uniref:uncharacterized protein LOC135847767 isoform X1 n=1 Tax=Planococcus citri TaxID=170843 RepID=UPI0031F83649